MSDYPNPAQAFLEEVDKNPELQAKVQEAQASLIRLGQEHGFDFTPDQLHDELRARWEINRPKDDPNTCTVTVP